MLSSSEHKGFIMVATRNKYYGSPNPSTGKTNYQPSISTQSNLDPSQNVILTEWMHMTTT